jgi:hypothetical protein
MNIVARMDLCRRHSPEAAAKVYKLLSSDGAVEHAWRDDAITTQPATKVSVLRWPCGTFATNLRPLGQRPCSRVMFVFTQVSTATGESARGTAPSRGMRWSSGSGGSPSTKKFGRSWAARSTTTFTPSASTRSAMPPSACRAKPAPPPPGCDARNQAASADAALLPHAERPAALRRRFWAGLINEGSHEAIACACLHADRSNI